MICVIVLWSWDIQKHTLRLPRVNHHLLGGTLPTEERCSHPPQVKSSKRGRECQPGMRLAGFLATKRLLNWAPTMFRPQILAISEEASEGFKASVFFLRSTNHGLLFGWTSIAGNWKLVVLRHEVWDHSNPQKHTLWASGKLLHNYGKSPFLMGKSTINGHFQ